MNMIPERSIEVLRAIVHDYIATKEPVGSKTLVDRYSFGVSAATIRNDMAFLEDEELIVAPHTSAGRVPTDKGYRVFVDRLNEVRPISPAEKQAIESFLDEANDLDDVLARTVQLLSKLTNQVAMVQYPLLGKSKVQGIELMPISNRRILLILVTDTSRVQQHQIEFATEISPAFLIEMKQKLASVVISAELATLDTTLRDFELKFEPNQRLQVGRVLSELLDLVDAGRQNKIILAGTSNLVRSETDFGGKLTPVLDAIEQQVVLLKLISELQTEANQVSIRIGTENQIDSLSKTSLLVAGFENQGSEISKLGLIGPTRMDYASNIAAVKAVARYLTKNLG